ncbi:MAG: hypothetical protein ACP5J8_02295, partial [Minisyncoccia bacterium]
MSQTRNKIIVLSAIIIVIAIIIAAYFYKNKTLLIKTSLTLNTTTTTATTVSQQELWYKECLRYLNQPQEITNFEGKKVSFVPPQIFCEINSNEVQLISSNEIT